MLQLCKACLGLMQTAVHDSLVGKHTGTKKPEAFSQQALHDLTLAGERSQTLILYPKREGFGVPTTRSPVFSGAALGKRVKCFVGKAGQDPTSM